MTRDIFRRMAPKPRTLKIENEFENRGLKTAELVLAKVAEVDQW